MPRPGMGQRSREDLECLGRGKWRCRNCDAILSEGAALMHHHRRDCRHPRSASRAVDRERKCLGCRAALAQLSALRERAAADAEDAEDAAEDAEDAVRRYEQMERATREYEADGDDDALERVLREYTDHHDHQFLKGVSVEDRARIVKERVAEIMRRAERGYEEDVGRYRDEE